MEKWAEVVKEPLGLAGFALFLVFLIARRYGKTYRHLLGGLAAVALLGGMTLAFWQRPPGSPPSDASAGVRSTASTAGNCSPVVSDTGGSVRIDPDCPSPATSPQTRPQPVGSHSTSGDGSPVVTGTGGDVTIGHGSRDGKR